ncbi:HAD family hydrolase [Plantactinospora sp. BB1]|uniref:HAD family hydrolase n=1 Tax=Plantactinospora sp. BB1 TaxID=2071627 RepID=UPI001F40855E|nr:HAD hydrolase-like protein [Plantactinospora sp. BB1]
MKVEHAPTGGGARRQPLWAVAGSRSRVVATSRLATSAHHSQPFAITSSSASPPQPRPDEAEPGTDPGRRPRAARRTRDCLLVGDSLSDIQAARAAGVVAIGYANKPGKRERFGAADAVIDSMADLVAAFAVDKL